MWSGMQEMFAPPAQQAPNEREALIMRVKELQRGSTLGKQRWIGWCETQGLIRNPATHENSSMVSFFETLESEGWVLPPMPEFGGSAAEKGGGAGPMRGKKGGGAERAGPYNIGGKGIGKMMMMMKGVPPEALEGVTEQIFVGSLPKTCTEDSIRAYFSEFGEVKSVEQKKDQMGHPRGFAFVTFAHIDSVYAVFANYDFNYMGGQWIDCKAAQNDGKGKGKGKGSKGPPPRKPLEEEEITEKVFIGGLPQGTREEDVRRFCLQFGQPIDISLKYNADNLFRGFAFVHMETVDAARALIFGQEGQLIAGQQVDCRPAQPTEHLPGQTRKQVEIDNTEATPLTCNVIRVRGLGYEVKQRDVFKLFYNFNMTRIRDCGGDNVFVEFSSQHEAEKAYRAKKNASIAGSKVIPAAASREEFEATRAHFADILSGSELNKAEKRAKAQGSGDGPAWTALVKEQSAAREQGALAFAGCASKGCMGKGGAAAAWSAGAQGWDAWGGGGCGAVWGAGAQVWS